MKAIVFYEQGGPEVLRLEDRPVPQIGATDVLLKVRAVSVNRSSRRSPCCRKARGAWLRDTPWSRSSAVSRRVCWGRAPRAGSWAADPQRFAAYFGTRLEGKLDS